MAGKSIEAVIFDFDRTLTVGRTSWEILHEAFGTLRTSSIANKLYCAGKITYREFMEIDLSLWPRPLSITLIERIADSRIKLREDAGQAVAILRECGVKLLAVVSSALDIIACKHAKRLGLDECIANSIGTDANGFFDGRILRLVEPLRKEKAAERLLSEYGLELSRSAAIADSECDKSLLESVKVPLMIGECGSATGVKATCVEDLISAARIICQAR